MARNLNGSTWDKQSRDINFKLAAFGKSRHHQDKEHQTHSDAIRIKRDGYKEDFIKYLKDEEVDESKKLNSYMNTSNVKSFLNQRTQNLSAKSKENYIRGFGAMLKGLQANKIGIDIDFMELDKLVLESREIIENTLFNEIHRAIENVDLTVNSLYEINEGAGLIANVQSELGLRVSEAMELIRNHAKYLLSDEMVRNLKGKGNHKYRPKQITQDLINRIMSYIGVLPSLNHYNKLIKKVTNDDLKSSHSFRYSYVKKLNELGLSHEEISKEINHNRLEITRYYIERC